MFTLYPPSWHSMARSRRQARLSAATAHSIALCQTRAFTVASAFPPWATPWLSQHSALMFSLAAPPFHALPPPAVHPSDGRHINWELNFMVRRRRREELSWCSLFHFLEDHICLDLKGEFSRGNYIHAELCGLFWLKYKQNNLKASVW